LDHLRERYIGSAAADPSFFMWFLVWWPYALSYRINPFFTHLIWVPDGTNVIWAHFIFAPSMAAWPLTRIFGPVFSYNVLCLAALALNAWSGFLLCRRLCRSSAAAFVGGFLFGFSPYVLGQLLGHLSLIMIFPVPLAGYLIIARFEDQIPPIRFTLLLALVLLLQFLCAQEIFASSVMFGSLAMLAAVALAPPAQRSRLIAICGLGVLALGISVLMSAPFWYYAIAVDYPHAAIQSAQLFSSDLLAFVVPTPLLLAGKISALLPISRRFSAGVIEGNSYLGLPLIAAVVAFAASNYRNRAAMLLVAMVAVSMILSLGPTLLIGGAESIRLPWSLATPLPLISQALPARFSMYMFLTAAIIVALWLASPGWQTVKWLCVGLGVISVLPNLGFRVWWSQVDTPRFFTDGAYKRYILKNETALVIPYALRGNSMLWQAETNMYFRMAGAYVSWTPEEYKYWPVFQSLFVLHELPNLKQQLEGFLAYHQVNVIIVAHHARDFGRDTDFFATRFNRDAIRFFAPLGINPVEAEDVLLYRLPSHGSSFRDTHGKPPGFGQGISITSVSQNGTNITVDGRGFSLLTVISLFTSRDGQIVNLGGFRSGWAPVIPTTSVAENRLTFTKPPNATGTAYVQALNPPYTSSTSSQVGPASMLVLH